jgi:hypothetical protein
MNENHALSTPMAFPFKIEKFVLARQIQLEHEVCHTALSKKMDGLGLRETLSATLKNRLKTGLSLPNGCCGTLEDAMRILKTRARLGYKHAFVLLPETETKPGCVALLEKKTLTVGVNARLLERCSGPELVFHLADALFRALLPTSRYLEFLLRNDAPFHFEDRFKVMELLRLRDYLAACFGFICCGDLEVARMVDVPALAFEYRPIQPLVLDRFRESAIFRTALGTSGGISREQFEAEVLEMDRQAHPPLTELPDDQKAFFFIATVLAAQFVMEAVGAVTPPRQRLMLEFLDINEAQVQEIARQARWDRRKVGQAADLLQTMLTGTHSRWANLHCVELLNRCCLLTLQEHNGRMPRRVKKAFCQLAGCCRLRVDELEAVLDALSESISAGQGE